MTMPDRRRLILTAAAAAAPGAALAKAASKTSGKTPARKAAAAKVDVGAPHLLGPADAAKHFVLWGSYTCPYTAALFPILLKLQAETPKRVCIEWRHFPLHPPDPALHVAGQGLAGDAFWGFTTQILAFYLKEDRQPDGKDLLALAQANGETQAWIDKAEADPVLWSAVKRDLIAGQLMGVASTPGLFVDGYFLTPDGMPSDAAGFEKSLRDMIAKA